ncbi:Hydroxymethylpyrimidine phosphate kinase ThiD [invertebrate metagenome]|uniref:Hydroxymethylpyrimidine phosphate kinase ThiD n=1 Tax=invertebrate metagenome TaxID=1711999 RepID=A0A484H7D0_9ZZZZ
MTPTPVRGRVLVCAGSDSGGGAGLQADIKAVTALGGYAMTAVTTLTAQNTQGVFAIHPVPPSFVARQIVVCLEDIGADVIKTGMLSTIATIESISSILESLAHDIPLIVDPVMVAKDGTTLLAADAIHALRIHLINRATLVTPNLPEAYALLGEHCALYTPESLVRIACRLLEKVPVRAVLLKGGHQPGQMVRDVLATRSGEVTTFTHKRINSTSTHGTGCTLAASVACCLAQGMCLEVAVRQARNYVHTAIATAPGFGHGHGPLNHVHTVCS